MKKFSVYIAVAAVLAIGTAFAGGKRSWPFSAPTVSGTGNVANPEQGNIIFDWISSTSGVFKGFDGASWVTLGGGSGGGVPVGTILSYAGATAPTGFLITDGSPVSRTTYADLYAAIGDAFGAGDGVNTFNVPDLRGRFLRGVDDGAGNDPDAATRTAINTGGNTGDNVGSLQADEFKSHTHTQTLNGYGALNGTGTNITNGAANGTRNAATDTQGAGGSETRPKNVYVNFIIKY